MTPKKRSTRKATPARPRPPSELDDLNYSGNDEFDVGESVTVSLRDGVAALTPQSFDRLTPVQREHGAFLMRLVGQRRILGREIDDLVHHMRDDGVSWGVIGWCVGTSSEAARQRWSDRS